MGKNSHLISVIRHGLVNLRKEKKLTQDDLAKRLCTNRVKIARMESGATVPSLEHIAKILDALDADIEIAFKIRDVAEEPETKPVPFREDYICLSCSYWWRSNLNRPVIRCPRCRQRSGIVFKDYASLLKAFKELKRDVKENPPGKMPPPISSLKTNIPLITKILLKNAGNTFPDPLPFRLIKRIYEHSKSEDDQET